MKCGHRTSYNTSFISILSLTSPIKAVLLHILIIERQNQEVTICMAGIRKTETKSSQEKYLTFVHLERI